MSIANRIQVNEIDKSQFVPVDVATTGAMVIESAKGPETPTYIPRGSETKITRLFGFPSVSTPDIWEALEYNKGYPL